jgi:hypothetical protein
MPVSEEGPADPFEPELPPADSFPPEIREFARMLLGEGRETLDALWGQPSFKKLHIAVNALDEAGAKVALLHLLARLKMRESEADWFTAP